ncbi:unnamed protein product [Linum trigynum]|uniref:Uncharacterized protein n=1 Tax=Linum trigynum TaxID=586398 RepID=A0AAV2E6B5_9ROSI
MFHKNIGGPSSAEKSWQQLAESTRQRCPRSALGRSWPRALDSAVREVHLAALARSALSNAGKEVHSTAAGREVHSAIAGRKSRELAANQGS